MASAIQISSIELKNFRCFNHLKLTFEAPYILLEGANGSGKTSILEALYYACYLRSFRTSSPRELVTFNKDGFFVKIEIQATDGLKHDIQIGFNQNKRLVKVDKKPIRSYKDLMSYYRIVSLTEDDLELINGSPQFRRLFLDQMLLLMKPSYGVLLKAYRRIVDQRNALLHESRKEDKYTLILAEQLWNKAKEIQQNRLDLISQVADKVTELISEFVDDKIKISISYRSRHPLCDSFDQFYSKVLKRLHEQEQRYKRSLFGAHLDDISISWGGHYVRAYASRGQQKLILLILKIAQLQILAQSGSPSIFLLDDFMTDFDEKHVLKLISALKSIDSQLIFTSPIHEGFLAATLKKKMSQTLKLTY